MPRVSVLMPTHNRAPTIAAAVNSVLGQTFQDWELIIYDDGSDDLDGYITIKGKATLVSAPTRSVLAKQLRDPRVRFERCAENKGVAHARNALMELATGEYCCWLDSDDMANIYRLEMCVDVMDTHTPAYLRSAATTFAKEDAGWKLPPVLLWRGGVSVATVMFRRDRPLEYDTRFKYVCEDMDWECRYAATYGKGMQIPLTLYWIGRRTPGRLSMKHKEDGCADACKRDKALKDKKIVASVDTMARKGYTKKPHMMPWSHLSRYMERWYRKYY